MKAGVKWYLLARHKSKPVAVCIELKWLLGKSKQKQKELLKDWEVLYICTLD